MAVGYTPVDDDLYREIILDHYRNPRHRETVDPADRVIEANNPLCGDEIDLSYRLATATGRRDRLHRSRLLDQPGVGEHAVRGGDRHARRGRGAARGALPRDAHRRRGDAGDGADIGDLEALRGVRAYPVRVKCATLVWNALLEGLSDNRRGTGT